MPIHIGEVQSEVVVDASEERHQSEDATPLARGEELVRWLAVARRAEWDEARTRACDFDD